ncbi:TcpE family conjugal transfer membrane protein [Streptococcus oralis]|nr:hypothetical protein H354_06831 [Streptococcus oralis subsp. tigurinus AZ_3a]
MERKDKKLYVYTTAFRQPIWVHKLNDDYSLPFAVKMSAIVYCLVILVLTWFILGFIPSLDWGWRFMGSVFAGWRFGNLLADYKLDGKTLFRFIYEYLKFWKEYDSQRREMYICKGIKHEKVRIIKRGINE